MEQYCENCGSEQTWTEDEARGELSCNVCGLVEPYQPDANAGDNAGTVGEERFRERVDRARGQAPGTIPRATRTDCNNRPISREMYIRMRGWEIRERGFQRPTEPMFYQLRSRMEELYGRYITDLMTFLIRATTRRLTSEQEAYRRGLTTSEKEALTFQSTSCSRGASVRGGGEQDMLTLMAIAIRELAYDYGLAAPINRNAEAAQHGLTTAQVRKVKSSSPSSTRHVVAIAFLVHLPRQQTLKPSGKTWPFATPITCLTNCPPSSRRPNLRK